MIYSQVICLFILLFINIANGNNASYISLSGQITRKNQVDVTANNVANVNSIGFEQDALITRAVKLKQNAKTNNTFAWSETTYRNGEQGPIKNTSRPLDIAIAGDGYFKVMTPKGVRYTLDGAILINNQSILVNFSNYPYLSIDNAVIEIPADFRAINITNGGMVNVDGEDVGQIGVFGFEGKDIIIKEGGNLYSIKGGSDTPLEEFTIISGALKGSNVNAVQAMAEMVEAQRTYALITDLMSKINDTESSVINKLTK